MTNRTRTPARTPHRPQTVGRIGRRQLSCRSSEGVSMAASQYRKVDSVSDTALLQRLAAQGRRPNLLIVGLGRLRESVWQQVMTSCAPPMHYSSLPGSLQLPRIHMGTLLLKDVARLTPSQQEILNEWLAAGRGEIQVVSITAMPLESLVERAEFDGRLFYRLNTIRLIGTDGDIGNDSWPIGAMVGRRFGF